MTNRRWIVGVAAALLAAALLAGCGGGSDSATSTTAAATSGPTPTGVEIAALYESECASCHGEMGSGGPGGALGDLTDADVSAIESAIADGKGGMSPFGSRLTPAETTALADFVAALE